jgi:hypothetical protein
MKLVRGGSIAIRINDVNSPFFKPGKGLRQGDPLSPLLFNLVVDMFTRMLIKATNKSYITGLINTLSQKVLSAFSMLMLIKAANKSYITGLINTLSQKVLSAFRMLMTHFYS